MDGDYWIGSVPGLSDFYVVNYGSKYGDDPNADVICPALKTIVAAPLRTVYPT